MKKQIFIIMVMASLLLLPLSSAFAADVFLTKTELIQWDPDKAYDGYNLFVNNGTFWLTDMQGRIVNQWDPADPDEAGAGFYAYLMENGNLRMHETPVYTPGGVLSAGGAAGRVSEYTWEGDRIWYVDVFDGEDINGDGVLNEEDYVTQSSFFGSSTGYYNGKYRFHHDAQRMYNKDIGQWTYMVLIWVAKDQTDADNMGIAPGLTRASRAKTDNPDTADLDESLQATWSPCGLVEILPDYASGVGGDIIWFWTFADHMVTTDPGDTIAFDNANRAADSWTDWGGRLSRPPLEVTRTYASGAGDLDSIEGHPELLDVNGMHYSKPDGPRTDYQHCNSFDYDENTGYVAINAKACNEFFVIDHDGTFDPNATANDWNSVGALARGDGGDFKYRYGNPGNYYSGKPGGFYNEGDMEMYGTHDIQWIMNYHWRPPMNLATDTWEDPAIYGEQYALDGGGDFLMFDNGCYNPMNAGSKIVQVNPYLQGGDLGEQTATYADGNTQYVWMATSVEEPTGIDAYGAVTTAASRPSINNPSGLRRRNQVTWEYSGGINDFYSSYISSTMRMPNGNTIICAGSHSHFFEVTPDKEVVWEYVMPPFVDPDDERNFFGVGENGPLPGAFASTKSSANMCFRFHRFGPDHPALKGRDLTPGSTLTGLLPATLDSGAGETYPPTPPAPTGWGTSGLSAGEGGGGAAGGSSSGGGTDSY
jgi:hypothetical protein